jgi:hypothetical protein
MQKQVKREREREISSKVIKKHELHRIAYLLFG